MHLYVHVPFCARRCSYCDFAIAVRRGGQDVAFLRAIEREWRWHAERGDLASSGPFDTVYFGGGTPSRLDAATIARILELAANGPGIASGAEVTLEANPEDVAPATASGWRAAGVNRVSLGVQSFSDAALAWMHRVHDAAAARRAVRTLRAAGFANVSLDLIYGLPEHLDRDWSADLREALALEPAHLSLYGLTVEPRTPLARWVGRGDAIPSTDARAAGEYAAAHARLVAEGWVHYEVSNAARPGLESRHNRAYWARAPYLGIGPSAHSEFGGRRWWNIREWEAWRAAVEGGRSPVAGAETLSPAQVALEGLYLGLRTNRGVSASSLPAGEGKSWISAGWARRDGGRIVLTAEGWLRLDALVGRVG